MRNLSIVFDPDTVEVSEGDERVNIDMEFERKLSKLLKKHGWKWYASGFDLRTGKRDIQYMKEAE